MAIQYIDNELPHLILRAVGALLDGGRLRFTFLPTIATGGYEEFQKTVQFSDPAFWEPVDQEMIAKPIESFTVDGEWTVDKVTFLTRDFHELAQTRSVGSLPSAEFRFKSKNFRPGEEYFIHDLRFVF